MTRVTHRPAGVELPQAVIDPIYQAGYPAPIALAAWSRARWPGVAAPLALGLGLLVDPLRPGHPGGRSRNGGGRPRPHPAGRSCRPKSNAGGGSAPMRWRTK